MSIGWRELSEKRNTGMWIVDVVDVDVSNRIALDVDDGFVIDAGADVDDVDVVGPPPAAATWWTAFVSDFAVIDLSSTCNHLNR